jgi:PRC-barrel domain
MKSIWITTVAASAIAATAAIAQTTTSPTSPTTPPAKIEVTPSPSTSAGTSGASTSTLSLTDAEAKAWINKVVYSSDNKNLGEVAAIARDSSGHVSELHADIGGFLGLGETRVRVMPSEFKLMTDKVVLNISADAAKSLPRIAK